MHFFVQWGPTYVKRCDKPRECCLYLEQGQHNNLIILMKTKNCHKVWCVSFYSKRCLLLYNTWLDILIQNLQKACVLRFACPVVSFTSVINLLSGCSSESSISPLQPFSYMYAAAIFHHKFKGIKIENDYQPFLFLVGFKNCCLALNGGGTG